MFANDSFHCESEFYYPDESPENEPVHASACHNNFKNVNKSIEITSDIKKIIKLFTV